MIQQRQYIDTSTHCIIATLIYTCTVHITHKFKEKFEILRDHRKKKIGKQERSPTPADILVNI